MSPQRANRRRNVTNNVELKAPQVSANPLAKQVTHTQFQAIFQVVDQSMTTQVNREVVALVNPILGMAVIQVREFTKMNPI